MTVQSDQVKQLTAQLEQGVRDVFKKGNYQEYLEMMARFHKYSYRNALLIFLQKPDAIQVAGFTTWKSLGRNVKKGEKGIRIFAPAPYKKSVVTSRDEQGNLILDEQGNPRAVKREITVPAFKPVYVFDVSQTEGKPLEAQLVPSELVGDIAHYHSLFEALRQSSPFPIVFEKISGGAEGYTNFATQQIVLNENKSQLQNIAVALHEITHARLHAERTNGKTRSVKEVEAESVAFIVSAYFGVQIGETSFDYIADWSSGKDLKELQMSLDSIQKGAIALINDISQHFDELHQEQRKVLPKIPQNIRYAELLINFFEKYGTPQYHSVFGLQEKKILINYASHVPDKKAIVALAAELAEKQFELTNGYPDPMVQLEVKYILYGDPGASSIDVPFVPPIELLSPADTKGSYSVCEDGDVFSVDKSDLDDQIFFEINSIDLETKMKTVVGFSREREYNFEATAYRHCLAENEVLSGAVNLQFPEYDGNWKVDSTINIRGNPYYVAYLQSDPKISIILDQSGDVLAEIPAISWEQSDLHNIIGAARAEDACNRANGRIEKKRSVADRLSKANKIVAERALPMKTYFQNGKEEIR